MLKLYPINQKTYCYFIFYLFLFSYLNLINSINSQNVYTIIIRLYVLVCPQKEIKFRIGRREGKKASY